MDFWGLICYERICIFSVIFFKKLCLRSKSKWTTVFAAERCWAKGLHQKRPWVVTSVDGRSFFSFPFSSPFANRERSRFDLLVYDSFPMNLLIWTHIRPFPLSLDFKARITTIITVKLILFNKRIIVGTIPSFFSLSRLPCFVARRLYARSRGRNAQKLVCPHKERLRSLSRSRG